LIVSGSPVKMFRGLWTQALRRLLQLKASSFRAGRRSGKFLLPEVIDGSVIEAYVRKALRVGVWRFMSPEPS